MSYQLMTQTQVSYHLSIVAVQNGDDTRIGIVPLLQLTSLFFFLWQVTRIVSSIRLDLATATDDILYLLDSLKMAASVYLNIVTIAGKSILWGVT
jgi:hypothetical protein